MKHTVTQKHWSASNTKTTTKLAIKYRAMGNILLTKLWISISLGSKDECACTSVILNLHKIYMIDF